MQPQGRDGRGGNNLRGGVGGGFPGFGDPFAPLVGPGFLSNMFDSEPFFSDPFFIRPFGSLFGNSGGGLFGPGDLFGQRLFPPAGFQTNARQNSIDERPYNLPPETARRGVRIEELPDDHDDGGIAGPTSNREPIIEHPEDDDPGSTEISRYQADPPVHQSRTSIIAPNLRSSNTPYTYSYQSSSVTYGGSNGPYYAAHSSRRRGPDGVYEEQHAEKDITTGKESHKVLHGLYNKGRALTRKRNAEGLEERLEMLHNLGQDEVQNFEKMWESKADKSFPRYKSWSQGLGSGSGSKSQAALPMSGGLAAGSRSNSRPDFSPGSSSGGKRVSSFDAKPGPSLRPKSGPNAGSKSGPSSGLKSLGDPSSSGGASRSKGELKSSKGERGRIRE